MIYIYIGGTATLSDMNIFSKFWIISLNKEKIDKRNLAAEIQRIKVTRNQEAAD